MAFEDLTLRMRAAGSRSSAHDVDRVTRAVNRLDRSANSAVVSTGLFSRAMTLLGTRFIAFGVIILALLPAVLPALGLMLAAAVALVGTIVPMFALAGVAAMLFKNQLNLAGSAAFELHGTLLDLKTLLLTALGPAAEVVMHGLSQALRIIFPLIQMLAPAFTDLAHVIATSLVGAAHAFVALGPDFVQMIHASLPVVQMLIAMLPVFIGALVRLAIVGMPVLLQILSWIKDFFAWLAPAIDATDRWARGAQAASIVGTVFHVIATAAVWVADVLSSLAKIVWELWHALQPLVVIVGGALLFALDKVRDVLMAVAGWVRTYRDELGPLIIALGIVAVAFGAVAAAEWLAGAALGVLTALMNINPIFLMITGLVLLAMWLHHLYGASEDFRAAVDQLWSDLRFGFNAVVAFATALKDEIGNAIDFIIPKIQWLIDKVEWVLNLIDKINRVSPIVDASLPGGHTGLLSDQGLLGIPGVALLADGGTVRRSGTAIVGEAGPELLHLPRGAVVDPLTSGGTEEFTVPVTVVLPSGEVLAHGVAKATRKRKSMR